MCMYENCFHIVDHHTQQSTHRGGWGGGDIQNIERKEIVDEINSIGIPKSYENFLEHFNAILHDNNRLCFTAVYIQ